MTPQALRIARWCCPEGHQTFSMVPDFVAAKLPGLLVEIDDIVAAASSFKSIEAAADAARGFDVAQRRPLAAPSDPSSSRSHAIGPANPLPKGVMARVISMARSAATRRHASATNPDARLYKTAEGQASKLCHMGHALMENRSGLVVAATTTLATGTGTGTGEREAAEAIIDELSGGHRITLGADKAYDTADFVAEIRRQGVTPQ